MPLTDIQTVVYVYNKRSIEVTLCNISLLGSLQVIPRYKQTIVHRNVIDIRVVSTTDYTTQTQGNIELIHLSFFSR